MAVLCLAACGGQKAQRAAPAPTLPRGLAAALAARSDAVADALAAADSCRAAAVADELQRETIAAINRGQVAAPLQESLSTTVNDLVARVNCVQPPQPPAQEQEQEHGRGKHKGHGKKGREGE